MNAPGSATAAEPAGRAEPAAPLSVLAFRVGAAELAVPIRAVREVLRPPQITRVPFAPRDVCGVAATRGALLPVIDLGLRLFGRPVGRPGCMLVVTAEAAGEPIAMLVDQVTEIVQSSTVELLEPPDEVAASLPDGWVAGVLTPAEGRILALLELRPVMAAATQTTPGLQPETEEQG